MSLSSSGDLSYVSPSLRGSSCVTNAFSGSPDDQLVVANYFLEGTNSFPRDPKRGVYWLTQSANAGNICALNQLGLCYLGGEGVMKDDQLGFRLIKIAAERGLEVAMMNIAFLASNGRGTPVDYPLAAEFLHKAADLGNADAAYQLAQFYLHGWGVPQDKNHAFQFFQQASGAGYAPARAALARCYEEGIGTDVDLQTARKFWLYAALNNDAVAARCVGERFLTGTGGFPVDPMKGRRYLLRAAEAGDAQAQYQLATCCTQGIGGPQNAMAGLKWLEKSAEQNYPEAVTELQAIRKEDERVQQEFKEMMENLKNAGGFSEANESPGNTSKRSKDAKKRNILKRIFRGKPGGAAP